MIRKKSCVLTDETSPHCYCNEMIYNVLDISADGMALVSRRGRFLKVNRALSAMTGYREKELLSIDFQSITHKDDLDAEQVYLRRMQKKVDSTYQLRKRLLHKMGHVIWVQAHVSAVLDGYGNKNNFVLHYKKVDVRRNNGAKPQKSTNQLALEGSSVYNNKPASKESRFNLFFNTIASSALFSTLMEDEGEQEQMEKRVMHLVQLAMAGELSANMIHEVNNINSSINYSVTILEDVWHDIKSILEQYAEKYGDFILGGFPFSKMRGRIPELLSLAQGNSRRIHEIINLIKILSRPNRPDQDGADDVDINAVVKNVALILENMIKKYTDHFDLFLAECNPIVIGSSQPMFVICSAKSDLFQYFT
ncbi:MAG: PAS domain S-box protein, partial [Magnetococcales bacterium]|nr:PAS domain S-box protein [Magnetococcales bacterium]